MQDWKHMLCCNLMWVCCYSQTISVEFTVLTVIKSPYFVLPSSIQLSISSYALLKYEVNHCTAGSLPVKKLLNQKLLCRRHRFNCTSLFCALISGKICQNTCFNFSCDLQPKVLSAPQRGLIKIVAFQRHMTFVCFLEPCKTLVLH